MGENRPEAQSDRSQTDRLTIAEAAALLGVHKNTVRNRIKDGIYEAETIVTERGPTYYIKRETILNNLTTNTLSRGSQELVSPQAMEFVQELLRPFVTELGEVREQLGAERARRELAEEKAASLEAELSEDRRRREVAERELGHAQRERAELRRRLAAREDAPESPESRGPSDDTPPDPGGGPETPAERPDERGWWRRWFGT